MHSDFIFNKRNHFKRRKYACGGKQTDSNVIYRKGYLQELLWAGLIFRHTSHQEHFFCFNEYAEEYLRFLSDEKNYSKHTIKGKRKVLCCMLPVLGQIHPELFSMQPKHIDMFFTRIHKEWYINRRTLAEYISHLRSFLRYAATQSWCSDKLSLALKAPRLYSEDGLPSAPEKEHVLWSRSILFRLQ